MEELTSTAEEVAIDPVETPNTEIEELRNMVVELQGLFAVMQETMDKLAPVEPAAEEVAEEATDDASLLEEEPIAEDTPEEDIDELDKLLQAV